MDNDLEALIAEIEAAAARLDGAPAPAGVPPLLADRFAAWRQVVSEHREGDLRDRVIWALLGAERHIRAMDGLAEPVADARAAGVRLAAAARALREMRPAREDPPSLVAE
jgi:hypothetical protein